MYDDIENEQENHIETPTTRQIVKPFHSMWMSTGEDMSSNNEEYLDGGSESFDASEHEFSLRANETSRRRLSLSPQIIPRRTTSHSLSPLKPEKRRWSCQPFNQSMSVPNSPLEKSKETYKLFTPGEFETSVSITSSEAIRWVPREFDNS